jgi:peroxiredoxin family protein
MDGRLKCSFPKHEILAPADNAHGFRVNLFFFLMFRAALTREEPSPECAVFPTAQTPGSSTATTKHGRKKKKKRKKKTKRKKKNRISRLSQYSNENGASNRRHKQDKIWPHETKHHVPLGAPPSCR